MDEELKQLNNETLNYNAEMGADIAAELMGDADANVEPLDEYKIKLSNFEGPLDLLLHLIRAAKVEIRDIFVSQVTEQFLAYIENLDGVDIDKAGEYMQMAATLLEIKSRALLPKIEDELSIDDVEDPETELIRRLEEYKLYKEASEKLLTMDQRDVFYKEPDDNFENVRVVYNDFNFKNLMSAFEKMLQRVTLKAAQKPQEKEIPKDVHTVDDKVRLITEVITEQKQVQFFDLFENALTRSEVIVTFQAMLELLKLQRIKVVQNEIYGDITVILNEEYAEKAEEGDLANVE